MLPIMARVGLPSITLGEKRASTLAWIELHYNTARFPSPGCYTREAAPFHFGMHRAVRNFTLCARMHLRCGQCEVASSSAFEASWQKRKDEHYRTFKNTCIAYYIIDFAFASRRVARASAICPRSRCNFQSTGKLFLVRKSHRAPRWHKLV